MQIIDSSDNHDSPATFEVGVSAVASTPLTEAFDDAVRGMAVGDKTSIQADSRPWKPELLFRVPLEHPEIERLAEQHKSTGGMQPGLVVELSNGSSAVVVEAGAQAVTLDANSALAGQSVSLDLELTHIVRPL